MIKNPLYRLYYFAGGAFLLALLKYVFVQNMDFAPKFFITEFLSFGLFLGIIYFFDRFIRETMKLKEKNEEELNKEEFNNNEKIKELEQTIIELKENSEGALSKKDEIELLGKHLISGLDEIKDNNEFAMRLLKNLAIDYELGLGICYMYDKPSQKFVVKATYGMNPEMSPEDFVVGEGLNGQAIEDKKPMVIKDIEEDYFDIESCSGTSKPKNIYLLPIVKDNETIGLIEMATFAYVNIDKQWEFLNNYIADVMSL